MYVSNLAEEGSSLEGSLHPLPPVEPPYLANPSIEPFLFQF